MVRSFCSTALSIGDVCSLAVGRLYSNEGLLSCLVTGSETGFCVGLIFVIFCLFSGLGVTGLVGDSCFRF